MKKEGEKMYLLEEPGWSSLLPWSDMLQVTVTLLPTESSTPDTLPLLRPQNPSPRPRTQSLEQLQWQRWRKRQTEEKDINQALAQRLGQTKHSERAFWVLALLSLSLSFTCSLQPLDTTSIRANCVYTAWLSLSLFLFPFLGY